MGCDCGCTNTEVNCTCPDPTGIEAARIENIVSAELGGGANISGAGYTYTLYTNTSSNTQKVYVQTNMYITCIVTHSINSTYLLNGVPAPTGSIMYEELATTKTDFTHFLIAATVPAAGVIAIKVISDNANGVLNNLTSFIYKHDI